MHEALDIHIVDDMLDIYASVEYSHLSELKPKVGGSKRFVHGTQNLDPILLS